MKNIVLQRRIAVRCWNVIGTVAEAKKRPELMPLLFRARERNRTSAEDVAEHLFFEHKSRRVVAERMLRIAVNYGLLQQDEQWFSLTDTGLAAIDSEQIFIPERGSWTIWACDDPLLDYPILRVDRWREPTALDDVQQGKRKETDARKFVKVPRMLRDVTGRIASPSCGAGGSLRVDEFDEKAEDVESGDDLKIVWNVGERKLRLEGSLRGASVSTILEAPDFTSEDVWLQLIEAEGLSPQWDLSRRALLLSFEETNERERESLRRDLAIKTPDLGDFGKFDALTIRDVSIHANTSRDAALWADWRLRARLCDYATRDRFDAWIKEATDPFANFRISIPSRADLAQHAWAQRNDRPTPMAWYLGAAEDWSL